MDLESQVEMKVSGPKGRPITRLDSIKQAILLFANAKLVVLIWGFLVRGDRPTHRRHVSIFLEAEQRLDAFQAEGEVSSDPVAIDAPGGFLLEWWSVFWDIFIARTNEKHSDIAASYIEMLSFDRLVEL